jgi:hypothetical protein
MKSYTIKHSSKQRKIDIVEIVFPPEKHYIEVKDNG